MKSLAINVLAVSMLALTGCTNIHSAVVEANAVCRDGWYGYSQVTCEPPTAPYGVAEAARDIADPKEQIQLLKDELTAKASHRASQRKPSQSAEPNQSRKRGQTPAQDSAAVTSGSLLKMRRHDTGGIPRQDRG